MKKRNYTKLLMIASVLSLGCMIGGTSLWGNTTVAETANTVDTVSFVMKKGATIRLSTSGNGLRFTCTLPAAEYEALESNEIYDSVSYGMLIAPADYVDETTKLTVTDEEGNESINPAFDWAVDGVYSGSNGANGSAKRIINLVSDSMAATNKDSNTYAFSGSLINLQDGVNSTTNNIDREFVGLGYIQYVIEDEVFYRFAEDNDNVRSMAYVAQAAIGDEESELSEKQITWLNENYIARVENNDTTYTVNYYFQNDKGEYELSSEKGGETNVKVNSQISVTPEAVDGYACKNDGYTGVAYANGKTVIDLYYKKNVQAVFSKYPQYYTENAEFDINSLELSVNYEGLEATTIVPDSVIGSPDMTAGNKNVTMKFLFNGEEYTISYAYTVLNSAAKAALDQIADSALVTLYSGFNYYEQNKTYEIGVDKASVNLTDSNTSLKTAYDNAVNDIFQNCAAEASVLEDIANSYEKAVIEAFQTKAVENLKSVADGLATVFNVGIFNDGSNVIKVQETSCEATKVAYGSSAWDSRVSWGRLPELYAPNLKRILEEYPSVKTAITTTDGNIYSLPTIYTNLPEGVEYNMRGFMWINTTWLENENLDMPKTPDEFISVMRVFKEKYCTSANSYPLAVAGIDHLQPLFNFFGMDLVNYWVQANEEGTVEFMPQTEQFKKALAFIRTLVSEGLMNPNWSTMDSTQMNANAAAGQVSYGCFSAAAPQYVVGYTEKYKEYDTLDPISESGEDGFWGALQPIQRGCFAITTSCQYPEAAIRWIDSLYDLDQPCALWGIIGEENVEWKWLDEEKTGWKSMISDQAYFEVMATTIIQTGDGMPYLVDESFWGKQQTEIDLYTRPKRDRQMKEGYLGYPNVYFDAKTLREMSDLSTDINSYIHRYIAAVLSGEKNLDGDWDTFKEFRRLQVDRYLEILQAAYDDYKI